MHLKGPNDKIILPGQIWKSIDGEVLSYIVGYNADDEPVVQQSFMEEGEPPAFSDYYKSIEKYWKSMYLHELVSSPVEHADFIRSVEVRHLTEEFRKCGLIEENEALSFFEPPRLDEEWEKDPWVSFGYRVVKGD